jgi:hypothetical protein
MTARTIYSVFGIGEDDQEYFETLDAAVAAAQEAADHDGREVEVQRSTVTDNLTGRALLVALLSGRGWARKTETVRTIKPRQDGNP